MSRAGARFLDTPETRRQSLQIRHQLSSCRKLKVRTRVHDLAQGLRGLPWVLVSGVPGTGLKQMTFGTRNRCQSHVSPALPRSRHLLVPGNNQRR